MSLWKTLIPMARATFAAIVACVFVLTFAATSASGSGKEGSGLKAALIRAFENLPKPTQAFRNDPEGTTNTLDNAAGSPAKANGVRVYTRTTGTGDDEETTTLEIRVTLNGDLTFGDPFGSEGGSPRAFTHDGLPAMRYSLAGVDEGRVAMPLSEEERANALTLVRLLVGPAAAKGYLIAISEGRTPEHSPWEGRPAKSSEIRTIAVEFYGPRAEVDRLVAATRAPRLRALLSPAP